MNYLASICLILAILCVLLGSGLDSDTAASFAAILAVIFGFGCVSALILEFLHKRSN